MQLPLSRRAILTGAAVGGGLFVGWYLWPRHYSAPLIAGEDEYGFGGWLTIGKDGVVTVAVPQLEMGQGVTTLLPQIVAVELGADWRQIAVQPVPPSGAQPNIPLAAKWAPLWSSIPSLADEPGDMLAGRFARDHAFSATADGTTLAAYEQPVREAAAAARAMLAMVAAKRWGTDWEQCEVEGGLVQFGKRTLRFGDLAEEAATMRAPDPAPLRPDPPAERPVGEDDDSVDTLFPRLDLPSKIDGSMIFAGDVRLPDLVFAAIAHGPIGMQELVGYDAKTVKKIRGLVGVVKHKRWIAAVASNSWQAQKALKALRPRFSGPGAVGTEKLEQVLTTAARGEGETILSFGDPDSQLQQGAAGATYYIAPALHAAIETASATARLSDGRLELWIASQAPEAARAAAGEAVGLSPDKVVLYPLEAGGSFDARLEKQHAIEVAQIAKAIGKPVQLTWSRAEESRMVPPRTPVAIALTASLGQGDSLTPSAWRARLACPATVREFGERLFDNATPEAAMERAAGKADPLACEGALPPYAIPNVAIEHVPVTLSLPTARLRGNAAAYTAFATECFIDELAARAARNPLLYRMEMLGQQPRLVEVLRRAAQIGEWGAGDGGTGEGMAVVRMDAVGDPQRAGGGRIACIAEARAGGSGFEVERLIAVVDIGRIVNLDLARQQIEGGLMFGLALARGSSAVWHRGMPSPARLGAMGLPGLADTPDMTIEFVSSDAPPFDPGELGVAVAPPAIANALYAATGKRFRRLPLMETVA
ncbi:molybdopterin cofactor-binding domain-containing protein [Qipengyuania algicida]|uniref:molybdopterin cofactor-binding domain-containing protein n=1 Tax=Qipengyuania algicida TaxID=1836209 RepID=UPI001F3CE6E0|nr:molybdopterin cofactor-binding domain-containing protein [Qipengyuania algicida]